jgi:hypothetical protein
MTVPEPREAPTSVPVIWGNVPQRNKNFTGRADILARLREDTPDRVTAVLAAGDPLPTALQGFGGVGKTTVAIEFAWRYRSDYDLVWWIPADQPALVRSSLAALADRLGLEAARLTGIEAAADAVLDALRRGEPYRRWLLIFDNADQPEDIKDIIPRGPGHVLVTSRNHRWQSLFETVPLDVFTRSESKEFLNKRAPKGLSDADADRVAERLGDLPLALEQAGAVHAETGMPVDEYLRLLDEHTAQILAEGKAPEYPMSMTAAWKLSVAALRDQLPQALELLRCCAFFGPDPIPLDVFRRATRVSGTPVSDLIGDPILLSRAVRELGRFALVRIEGRSILVHRLIQALLRDELSPQQQVVYRDTVHLVIAAAAPVDPANSGLWPRFNELLAHVGSPVTELATAQSQDVRDFLLSMIRYLYVSGDLKSCQLFATRFIEEWGRDVGRAGPDAQATESRILDARRHLANALRQLGEYQESYRLTEATLNRSQELLGNRDQLTLSLRNSFAADLRARGEFTAALDQDAETRDRAVEVFGRADPQTLRVLNNLAGDYALTCQYKNARELHERVFLLQSTANSGVSETDILTSWNGLAWAARLTGSYGEARDASEDARDYGREKLGAEHYVTLRSVKGLSIALRRIAAARAEALDIAREVYSSYRRLSGDRHPDTLAAAINLSNALRANGELIEALELAGQTSANYPAVYGPEHPYRYGCDGNFALLLRTTGDAASARQLNEAALAGLQQRLGRDHDYTLVVAVNLASDLASLGDSAAARAIGEDALPRLRKLMGEHHPFTLGCAANLALDRRADFAAAEAKALTAETLAHYEATLGPDHPDVQVALAGGRLDFDFDPPPI